MPLRARHVHRNPATEALVPNVTENVVRIFHHKRVFHLRRPIDLTVREDAGRVLIGYAPLGIEAWGDDELEALTAFAEEFEVMWDLYGKAKEGDLTPGARKLKKTILSLVERAA